jgi:hypothetical protein
MGIGMLEAADRFGGFFVLLDHSMKWHYDPASVIRLALANPSNAQLEIL